jgi:hypothetical protein
VKPALLLLALLFSGCEEKPHVCDYETTKIVHGPREIVKRKCRICGDVWTFSYYPAGVWSNFEVQESSITAKSIYSPGEIWSATAVHVPLKLENLGDSTCDQLYWH